MLFTADSGESRCEIGRPSISSWNAIIIQPAGSTQSEKCRSFDGPIAMSSISLPRWIEKAILAANEGTLSWLFIIIIKVPEEALKGLG